MVVTEPQAREMQSAIELFQQKDNQTERAQRQSDLGIATAWFNTQGINIQSATTRSQALTNFNNIKALQSAQTDRIRLIVLGQKLSEANEKYKEVKRLNP